MPELKSFIYLEFSNAANLTNLGAAMHNLRETAKGAGIKSFSLSERGNDFLQGVEVENISKLLNVMTNGKISMPDLGIDISVVPCSLQWQNSQNDQSFSMTSGQN